MMQFNHRDKRVAGVFVWSLPNTCVQLIKLHVVMHCILGGRANAHSRLGSAIDAAVGAAST